MLNPIERVTKAFNAMPAAIAIIDSLGEIRSVNAAWHDMAVDNGGNIETCGVGANYLDVCDNACGEDMEDAQQVGQGIRAVLKNQLDEFSYDYSLHMPTSRRWFRVTVRPVNGGALIMHFDITGLCAARALASANVGNDGLTDFASRRLFDLELEQAVKRALRDETSLALIVIKVGGLPAINARFDYQIGDVFLREMAARLRAKSHRTDKLARLSGDDFAVIHQDMHDRDGVERYAQSYIRVLHKPLLLSQELIHPTISVGLACMPEHARDSALLVDFAEQAMRIAENRGGGLYRLSLT